MSTLVNEKSGPVRNGKRRPHWTVGLLLADGSVHAIGIRAVSATAWSLAEQTLRANPDATIILTRVVPPSEYNGLSEDRRTSFKLSLVNDH